MEIRSNCLSGEGRAAGWGYSVADFRQTSGDFSGLVLCGAEGKVRDAIEFARDLTMVGDNLGSRIVLVDDLVDSGISLDQGIAWLKSRYGDDIQEIRTAVIWYKACSVTKPDYYVDYLADNPWIHQPFEMYEKMSAADLAPKDGS